MRARDPELRALANALVAEEQPWSMRVSEPLVKRAYSAANYSAAESRIGWESEPMNKVKRTRMSGSLLESHVVRKPHAFTNLRRVWSWNARSVDQVAQADPV
jgi:hypothetical protein